MQIPVLPSAALVVLSALLAVRSGTQDPHVAPETLNAAQRLSRTVPEHERLARLEGAWDVTIRATPPGDEERTERGTVVGKAILGGRYVVLNFQLTFRGEPLEAVQILGYDTLLRQYTSSWRDDHSTWSVECAGPADTDAPERVQLRGTLRDAQNPDGRPFRLALTLPEADGGMVAVSLHDTLEGTEHLLQTQQWTRR
ncbi:MAG: DUF1579 family protein [Planctomycetes bacterium]|nr:DUF1579 family protein [Planctomycetota bacterium]